MPILTNDDEPSLWLFFVDFTGTLSMFLQYLLWEKAKLNFSLPSCLQMMESFIWGVGNEKKIQIYQKISRCPARKRVCSTQKGSLDA
jgi:hypothetical protein